jgi:hypothetical protein
MCCSELNLSSIRTTNDTSEYSLGLAIGHTSLPPSFFVVVSTSGVGRAAEEDEQDGYGASRCDAKRLGGVSGEGGETLGDVPTNVWMLLARRGGRAAGRQRGRSAHHHTLDN